VLEVEVVRQAERRELHLEAVVRVVHLLLERLALPILGVVVAGAITPLLALY
jgi:hypothetical protein